jgi:cytochrome c1
MLSVLGCGSGGEPADAGVRGDGGPLVGKPMRGMMLLTTSGCATASVCHGADLAGQTTPIAGSAVYPRNITPDVTTGIGAYTDDEIGLAVRTGVTHGGRTLCPNMPRFSTMTDQQVADLIAYLRSVDAESRVVPTSTCD